MVGDEALIGNHATLLDGVLVGARALVAAGSLVAPNTVIPPEVLAVGSPARVRGALGPGQRRWVETNADAYLELVRHYRQTAVEVDEEQVRTTA